MTKPLIQQLLTRRNPAVDALADSLRDGHHLHRAVANILLHLDEQTKPECSCHGDRDGCEANCHPDICDCTAAAVAHVVSEQALPKPPAAGVSAFFADDLRDPCCWVCTPDYRRMLLCPKCCNKRCPRASDHRFACTNSNEPGQVGFADPPPALEGPLVPGVLPTREDLLAGQRTARREYASLQAQLDEAREALRAQANTHLEQLTDGDPDVLRRQDINELEALMAAAYQRCEGERDRALERISELEQRLARVAELAHDRDGDSLDWRSKRLGQCASIAWDHMEESFSDDPLKKRSTLKWAHLAKQLSQAEDDRLQLSQKLEEAMAHGRVLSETSGPVISSLKRQRDELARKLDSVVCSHTETVRGKDIPRRYGSYRSEVCVTCGRFRALTHHNDEVEINGHWRPASEYDAAVASSEDE